MAFVQKVGCGAGLMVQVLAFRTALTVSLGLRDAGSWIQAVSRSAPARACSNTSQLWGF